MNNYVLIIYGASGDLAKRKLLPALYHLIAKHDVKDFIIIGAAFASTTAQQILARAKEHIHDVDETQWQRLVERFYYQPLDFNESEDYAKLKQRIDQLKQEHTVLDAHTLVYLATAAHFFCAITTHSAQAGIARRQTKKEPWTRLVYEKPFGNDAATAREINSCIARYFNEDQIYRIDHYLTKELVSNIALVRFSNAMFEPLWNNRYIDSVQIVLSETSGIGSRGQYYDHFGALSDVVQNHMLELLALIGMEAPEQLQGNYIRDQRVKVLQKVKVIDAFLGQYDGYRNEKFVDKQSRTETFACVFARIENERWFGVPFYLKTGKCLAEKETKIHIKFKTVDCLLATCPIAANVLTIEISPQAGFSLRLNAKKPGPINELIPVTMDFCHSCIFGLYEAQAYETLLEGVFRGEQSISVRFDEIEAAWRVIDTVKKDAYEVYGYACDSDGPKEFEQFNNKHGIRWLS